MIVSQGVKRELKPMPGEQLLAHIIEFLHAHNVCMMATTQTDILRATALEYEAEGTTFFIMVGPGYSPKLSGACQR